MKRAIYHRGFIIHNHDKERGLLIITLAQKKILIKNALTFDECKWWIDRNLTKLAISQVFKA